ncbi:hypothetical protein [Streptococcus sanguinis]|uniref:hypothetical protein n=1 Tax=Streptococcus sanguinis TaxID=1305 RepID=UPI000F20B652|nr:hypothetical protein [Streptococcus sanguinis]MCC3173151.1 hypothetical protein [Streptococcus sanguinis]RKV90054.1 MAG: hypothetical protein D8H99_33920 [Streptococcus sp.]RSI34720.1 hypothetical protein D8876_08175 [Streptococcus sanguinis]
MINLPNNGSIVILDDQYTEAEPLIKLLSKNNKSFRYYDGKYENLPLKSIEKEATRLVFLDYNLTEGTTGSASQVSTIAANLTRIIDEDNGPYFILLWSKNKNDAQEFNNDMEKIYVTYPHLKPLEIKCLNKADYFETEVDGYKFNSDRVEEFQRELEEMVSGIELLEFYSSWENKILLTSQKLIKKTSDVGQGMSAKQLVHLLSHINLEQFSRNVGNEQLIVAAYQSLNTVFSSYLNHKIEDIKLSEDRFSEISSEDNYEVNSARVNSWLNINTIDNPSRIGQVFSMPSSSFLDDNIIKNNELRGQFIEIANQNKTENDYFKTVGLEISPECDVAQNKRNFYRVIPGMVISESLMKNVFTTLTNELTQGEKNKALVYSIKANGELNFKCLPQSIFLSPKFEFKANGECFDVFLILDLSQFRTIPIQDESRDYFEDKEMLFSVNSDLLQSIKNSLAANIQRKGFQSL